MIKDYPNISVLLPVYNAERYLKDAIESILNQSYNNFELILLDDGSNDSSPLIINKYAKLDNRIISLKNGENKGLIFTLNKGIELAKGKYIARMDADDIAKPNRFEQQFIFLEAHPEIVALGSNYTFFGHEIGNSNLPVNSEEIELMLYFKNVIAHPTVMIRTLVLNQHNIRYDPKALHLEDWAMWLELIQHGKLANLSKNLLEYRIEGQNISIRNRDTKKERGLKLLKNYLHKIYGENVDMEVCNLHWDISNHIYRNDSPSVICERIEQLKKNLLKNTHFNPKLIEKVVHHFSQEYFYRITDYSIKYGFIFLFRQRLINIKSISYLISKVFKTK